MNRLLSRVALGAALVAGLFSAGAASPAHAAGPWTLTLEASTYNAESGEDVILHAFTQHPSATVDSPYEIQIYNQTTGERICPQTNDYFTACPTVEPDGAYQYIAYIGRPSYTAPPPDVQAVSNPITVAWAPLGGADVNPAWPSQSCRTAPGSIALIDNLNVEGGTISVIADSSATDTHLCYRVDIGEDTLNIGGRLNIHHGTPNVGLIEVGLPSVDDQVAQCAVTSPPNAIPGSHPMASGTIAGQFVAVDSYLNTTVGASVCVTVGSTKVRVKVPFEVGSPTVDPGISVSLTPDPA